MEDGLTTQQSDPGDWETVKAHDPGDWENVSTATPHAPANTSVQGALKGLWEGGLQPFLHGLNPTTYLPDSHGKVPIVSDVKNTAAASLNTAKGAMDDAQHVTNSNGSISDKAASYFRDMHYAIPVIGPALKQMDDLQSQGKSSEAYGQAAGLIVQILGPHVLPKTISGVADTLDRAGVKVAPRVSNMMNQYIGLQPSDLQKFKRTIPTEPEEIGNTTYQQAGFKNTLPEQKASIDAAIQRLLDQQHGRINQASQPVTTDSMALTNGQKVLGNGQKMLMSDNQNPGPGMVSHTAKPTADVQRILKDSSADLLDEVLGSGRADDATLKAIVHNHETLNRTYAGHLTPNEMLEMRRGIKPKNFAPDTTDINQRFRQIVYHRLNDEIQGMLPDDQASHFRSTNNQIHRLITASEAAGEKLTKQGMKYDTPVKSGTKIASPSKWSDMVPNDTIIPREFKARTALSGGLRNAAAASRAGSGVARYIQAPDIVSQAGNNNDQQ